MNELTSKRVNGIALLILILSPLQAQAVSIFDAFYNEALPYESVTQTDPAITLFAIESMKTWGDDASGIVITPADIRASEINDKFTLCANKFTLVGRPIGFSFGGGGIGGFTGLCDTLQRDILSLVNGEKEMSALATDLIAISSGDELAQSDEWHRPIAFGQTSLAFNRLWSQTGAEILPWPQTEAVRSAVQALNAALISEQNSIDQIVTRFHYGFWRDYREADPAFSQYGQQVQAALANLVGLPDLNIPNISQGSNFLSIVRGEYATPSLLGAPNVALWARGDDIGLHWITPTHLPREVIKPAGRYPTYNLIGDVLAYPYSYTGPLENTSTLANVVSPLCSRSSGRRGLLCRPVEQADRTCPVNQLSDSIVLSRCDQQQRETVSGPEFCTGSTLLFRDIGQPLDQLNSSSANQLIAENKVCTPDSRVLYRDGISGHACYIGQCLVQSIVDHALVGQRAPFVINESTSPFLAFLRPDPELGVYDESIARSPIIIPSYIGHEIVAEFERTVCGLNGLPSQPLPGWCRYLISRRTDSPLTLLHTTTIVSALEWAQLDRDQENFEALAATIGQRLALDQTLPVLRKQVGVLALTVQSLAQVLTELTKAPITDRICPWNGPPQEQSSASAGPVSLAPDNSFTRLFVDSSIRKNTSRINE